MSSATLFCDSCGAANRPQAIFCASCGRRIYVATGGSFSTTLTGLLAPRNLLNRRYRIVGQAGQGGFGAVYKAEDIAFGNRLVAVKEMSQNGLSTAELAEATRAFKYEALLLAGLKHPNLPSIYDQFSENGRWYLVMDFIEGETLETILEQKAAGGQGRLPLEQALTIAIQLCAVLDYLHTRQPPIIFRDLKPANVMLTAQGLLYLIDFGIARLFKPGQARDTAALGSTGYAAPEQYGKAQTTVQTDLYGLGATLHQMLTGDDPSDSPFHFAPLHDYPEVPHLAPLLAQLLELTVSKRPASAALVRQHLQEIASHYQQLTSALAVAAGTPASAAPGGRRATPPGYGQTSSGSAPRMVVPQKQTLFICRGHRSRITSLAWSPDGTHIASTSYDKTARLWDGSTGDTLRIYRGHTARVNALAWSPDGIHIATASSDCTVQVWETATGTHVLTYRGHLAEVTALAWSPDGRYLASGDAGKSVQVWQVRPHSSFTTRSNHAGGIHALGWSPDGKRLACAGDQKTLQVWDPLKAQRSSFLLGLLTSSRTHILYAGHSGHVQALSWAPDGKYIASGGSDKTFQVWNALTGRRIFFYSNRSATITTVAWAPDNSLLAFGSNDRTVQIWHVARRKFLATYQGHIHYVTSVAWAPDSRRIASAGVDRTIQVWSVDR